MESVKGSLLLCSVINCTAVTSLVNTLPGKRARSKGSKESSQVWAEPDPGLVKSDQREWFYSSKSFQSDIQHFLTIQVLQNLDRFLLYLLPSIILRFNSPLTPSLLNCSYFDDFFLQGHTLNSNLFHRSKSCCPTRQFYWPFVAPFGIWKQLTFQPFFTASLWTPSFSVQLDNWPVLSGFMPFMKHLTKGSQ